MKNKFLEIANLIDTNFTISIEVIRGKSNLP